MPREKIGSTSREMVTAYRTTLWHWTEWHERDQVEQSKFVDVPYKRYPRTFPPPAVELTLATDTAGQRIVRTPGVHNSSGTDAGALHAVNMMLEIFGQCTFYDSDLNGFIEAPIKRLNWQIPRQENDRFQF